MKVLETPKKRKSLLFRLAVLTVVVYVLFSFVDQQIVIGQKRQELADKQAQQAQVDAQVEEMRRLRESGDTDELMEMLARQDEYYRSDEKVFIRGN